jgi:hypothetical protein
MSMSKACFGDGLSERSSGLDPIAEHGSAVPPGIHRRGGTSVRQPASQPASQPAATADDSAELAEDKSQEIKHAERADRIHAEGLHGRPV